MNKPAPHQPTATLVAVAEPKPTEKRLLVLNAGSSSLNFALFERGDPLVRHFSGNIERIGSSEAMFTLKGIEGQPTKRLAISAPNHVSGLEYLLKHLAGTTGTAAFSAGRRSRICARGNCSCLAAQTPRPSCRGRRRRQDSCLARLGKGASRRPPPRRNRLRPVGSGS